MQKDLPEQKSSYEPDWTRVTRVVRLVTGREPQLTPQDRRNHELVSLLEAPKLTKRRWSRLEHLLQSIPEQELVALLAASSASELSCLRVPRHFRAVRS